MTDAYTYIAKPAAGNYTNINTAGKQQYDQSDIFYDDPNVFYDGVDVSAYTNVAKPSSTQFTIQVGMATGLLIPPTYSKSYTIGNNPYTLVSKPTT